MSPRPFAEQEAELLIELADLFAFRAEREKQIVSLLATGLAAAERDHREATESARAVHAKASAEAMAEHATVKRTVEASANAELAQVQPQAVEELRQFQRLTEQMEHRIAKRMEQSRWLAETMVESANERLRPAFESVQKSVARKLDEVGAIEQAAGTALASRRHAPMGAATEAGSVADETPATPEDLDAAVKVVHAAAYRLRRAIHPRLARSDSVAGVLLLGAVIGGGIAGGREWMEPMKALPGALPGAGIGAGVALVLLILNLLISRLWVGPAARAMAEAIDRARTTAGRVVRTAEAARDAGIASLESKSKEEMKRAKAAVAPYIAEVEKRKTRLEPEMKARHEAAVGGIQVRRDGALAENDARLAARMAELNSALQAATRSAEEKRSTVRREVEGAERAERMDLESTWSRRLQAALQRVEALAAVAAEISPGWGLPVWERVPVADETPPGVRFGSMKLDLAALPGGLSAHPRLAVPGPVVRELPLMLDLSGKGSVFLRAGPEQREAALNVLNNLTLRLLTGLPPGKARFTLVDPVGLGQSFAGLMHLSDYEKAIVGERIWTEPAHIEQRLTDLTEHMETVIQKYLRNQYETIQAYNAVAGEVAEPYRFLVIADFPAGISDTAAKRLASIATSGARCGVFMLMMTTRPGTGDPRAGRPGSGAAIPWAEVAANSIVLKITPDGARWGEEPFSSLPVQLERAPDEEAASQLLHQIGEHARDSTRVRLAFSIVEPDAQSIWSGDSSSELRLPLGRAGAKKLQYMSLGRGTAQHALIAGRTGSGKSTLLHVIIASAALWYGPDQVELYLVDFKKGVEFKTYATHRLPHARVVAVESEREFGLSVLKSLDAEMNRRGALFRSAGVQDLAGFRRWQAQEGDRTAMPRVLLIVDEFQEFFVEDDRLAQDAGLLLDRLVRQGRAFGMHVILGSQTLAGAYTPARSTLGQMAVRIALQCSEADSYLIMSEDNPAPRLLSRPGEAIYNDANGMLEANSPFQIVWLPDDVREDALRRVREKYAAGGAPPLPQLVFEGNSPGDLGANPLLAGLIAQRGDRPPSPVLWLGEPLSIKGPTGIALHAQSAANTLIVGSDEERALAMTASAVLSLAAWLPGPGDSPGAPTTSIAILDATPPDHPHAGLLSGLAAGLGGFASYGGPRQAGDRLSELGAEIDRREASGAMRHSPALLVIQGLQRFRELRKSDEYAFPTGGDQAPTPAQLLAKVLRSGPPVGVHVLIWCDTATNFDRALERSAIREFNSRVLMQMSGGDSTQLIENQGASNLGRHRALLYQDETGSVERFRPYSIPSPEWLAGALRQIEGSKSP